MEKYASEQYKKIRCFVALYATAMSLTVKFDVLIYEMFFYPGIDLANVNQLKGNRCNNSRIKFDKKYTFKDLPYY